MANWRQDTQHKVLICDTQHNNTANLLSVVIQNVIMLSVVAPSKSQCLSLTLIIVEVRESIFLEYHRKKLNKTIRAKGQIREVLLKSTVQLTSLC